MSTTILKTSGKISSYLWTFDVNVLITTVLTVGPVVVGTNWYNNMFTPDRNGLIRIGGRIVGGHAYEINGVDAIKNYLELKTVGVEVGDNKDTHLSLFQIWQD